MNSARYPRSLLSAVRLNGLGWVACAVALVLGTGSASAHQTWLENEAAGPRFYFGEFGVNQREASPGYLDKLRRISATVVSAAGERELAATKGKDGYNFAGKVAAGESVIAADLAYPLIEGKSGTGPQRTAWTPAARYVTDFRAQTPKLTLDVVPTGETGEFQVVFRGAPLPNADVSLVAQSGWSLSGSTDAQGKVKFALPWKGLYALLVRHKEATAGTRKDAQGADEAYDAASFATTLTFVRNAGLQSPARPALAKPSPPPSAGGGHN
jgi:uncharacterized GH25 family protein